MSSPRVSVVMTTYNGERFLGKAIESVLFQSYKDLELIVVDDGSTDSSASVIRSFCEHDSRVRGIFLKRNLGIPSAANHGLRAARGEYVARMDSDDLCHRDRLQIQVSHLDKHAEIHVLGCRYREINEEGSFFSVKDSRRIKKPLVLVSGRHRVAKRVLFNAYPIFHPTIVCRRSTLLSVGGYREFFPIGEDDDLYFRIVNLHGSVLDNLPEKLYYYRCYGGSTTQKFSRSFSIFIINLIALSSEFRRRDFWDPLEEHPSSDCGSLHFRGVSSFLYLQDSLEFLPYHPREGLYSLLRVIVILRRFELKDFYYISLWYEWGMTINKQIYFYTSFCKLCFRLQKFRAGFLYFRYILSLYRRVSPLTMFSSFFMVIYYFIQALTNHHLSLSRSLILTNRWYYGIKYLLLAFCYNPFFVTKFFLTRFFVHSSRIMHVLYGKLRF